MICGRKGGGLPFGVKSMLTCLFDLKVLWRGCMDFGTGGHEHNLKPWQWDMVLY